MFCKYCGKQLADDELVCAQCGKSVAEEPAAEQETEAPKEMIAEDVVAEEATFDGEAFVKPVVEEPTKKKRGFALIAAIIAVVLACTIVVGAFYQPIKGLAIKTFGSNEEYLQFVEGKNSEAATKAVSKLYGTYLEEIKAEGAGEKASITINAGEKAINLLESSLGGSEVDFDWLKSISLDVDSNIKDKMMQYALGLKLNGKELVNAELITNLVKGELFLGVPSLSDKYLQNKMETNEDFDIMLNLSPEELKAALPSAETVNALLDKYIAIVYTNLEGVDKTTETVKMGDIEQKLTVLEVEIDYEMAKAISIEILETADEDAELAKIIKDFAAYLEENEIIEDAEKAFDDFKDSIDDALEEYENDEDVEGKDETITIKTYVDGSHQIVGRKTVASDENGEIGGTSAIIVRDGENFACEVKTEELKVTGKGTVKKNVLNGTYTAETEDEKLFDLTFTDYTVKDDRWSGKMLITPSNDLLEDWGLDSKSASVVSLASPELEIVFDVKKDAFKMDLNLLTGKDLFAGLTITSEKAEATEIETPKSGDTFKEEDVQKWMESWNLDSLETKLKDAGVPAEIAESFTQGLKMGLYPETFE